MCLIVFACRQHPEYPLILIANRDEYHARPTSNAGFWPDQPELLAGRDQLGKGTWLGLRRNGRFAAVTNFREGIDEPGRLSRGDLSRHYLQGGEMPEDYLEQVSTQGEAYGGFNLLFGNRDKLFYFSNRVDPGTRAVGAVTPGLHSLSNHLLNSPWPKSEHAKDKLAEHLSAPSLEPDALLRILQRRRPFADELLPDTGVSLERERTLSPPFIVTPEYGTRCTTLLLWHKSNQVTFIEQNYAPDGSPTERGDFQISVD